MLFMCKDLDVSAMFDALGPHMIMRDPHALLLPLALDGSGHICLLIYTHKYGGT